MPLEVLVMLWGNELTEELFLCGWTELYLLGQHLPGHWNLTDTVFVLRKFLKWKEIFFFAAYANHWKLLSQILVCSTVLECVFIGWNSTTDEIVELFEQVLLLKFSMISFFCKGVTIWHYLQASKQQLHVIEPKATPSAKNTANIHGKRSKSPIWQYELNIFYSSDSFLTQVLSFK